MVGSLSLTFSEVSNKNASALYARFTQLLMYPFVPAPSKEKLIQRLKVESHLAF